MVRTIYVFLYLSFFVLLTPNKFSEITLFKFLKLVLLVIYLFRKSMQLVPGTRNTISEAQYERSFAKWRNSAQKSGQSHVGQGHSWLQEQLQIEVGPAKIGLSTFRKIWRWVTFSSILKQCHSGHTVHCALYLEFTVHNIHCSRQFLTDFYNFFL